MRWASTRVLPEPAPATMSSGPPSWATAWRGGPVGPGRRGARGARGARPRLCARPGPGAGERRAALVDAGLALGAVQPGQHAVQVPAGRAGSGALERGGPGEGLLRAIGRGG